MQVERPAAQGERRRVEPGDVLFRQGDVLRDFFVVLRAGSRRSTWEALTGDNVISVHGPCRFLGELSSLTGQAAVLQRRRRHARRGVAVPSSNGCASWSGPTPRSGTSSCAPSSCAAIC